MNPALDKAVSQITTGFYAIAIAAVALGLLAVVIGRKVGGKATPAQSYPRLGMGNGLVAAGVVRHPKAVWWIVSPRAEA